VQDAFCRAVDLWAVRGVPENPAGWLMTTGRTLDVLRRERTARHFAPKLGRLPDSEWTRAAQWTNPSRTTSFVTNSSG